MAVNQYDVGDLVRVSVVFRSIGDNVPTDPTGVTMKYRLGTGSATTLVYGTDAGLVKDSTGGYHVDVDVDGDGTWYYRFAGTGAIQAAVEGSFVARATNF